MYNIPKSCLSAALKIEDERSLTTDNAEIWHYSYKSISEEISEICNKNGLVCRKLDSQDDSLYTNEWLIAFFGFIPLKRDYEGTVERWDYHFIFKENGKWFHRPCSGAKEIIPIEENLFDSYAKQGYSPNYFAIKKERI